MLYNLLIACVLFVCMFDYMFLCVLLQPDNHSFISTGKTMENLNKISNDWSIDENQKLVEALKLYSSKSWAKVAEHIGTKTKQQTYDHFTKFTRQKYDLTDLGLKKSKYNNRIVSIELEDDDQEDDGDEEESLSSRVVRYYNGDNDDGGEVDDIQTDDEDGDATPMTLFERFKRKHPSLWTECMVKRLSTSEAKSLSPDFIAAMSSSAQNALATALVPYPEQMQKMNTPNQKRAVVTPVSTTPSTKRILPTSPQNTETITKSNKKRRGLSMDHFHLDESTRKVLTNQQWDVFKLHRVYTTTPDVFIDMFHRRGVPDSEIAMLISHVMTN